MATLAGAAVEEEVGIFAFVVVRPSNWGVLVGMLLEERWLQRWVGAEGREMVVLAAAVEEEDWTASMMMWGILDIEERYLLS